MSRSPCLGDNGRCPNYATKRGRCPEHARQYNRDTTSAFKSIYNSKRWKLLRRQVLFQETMCRECWRIGQYALAEEVDHIIPLAKGGAPFDPANLAPLCKPCHSTKTRREQAA